MAWIESHQSLIRHPKTKALARRLGISRVTAIGHLHCLWWWALEYAEDGDLSNVPNDELAEEAMWEGDPDHFRQALTEAGFLDNDGHIHDWAEYTGRIVAQRESNRDRQRRFREKHRDAVVESNGYVTVTSRERNAATVPNRTVPNHISETTSPLAGEPAAAGGRQRYPAAFESFWTDYGPTTGPKKPAHTAWQRLSKADQEAAIAALPAWKTSESWCAGFKPYPQKYINQRYWEATPEVAANGPVRSASKQAEIDRIKAKARALSQTQADPNHPGRPRL